MIRLPPRSTLDRSSAAADVYKRQHLAGRDAAFTTELAFGTLRHRAFYDAVIAVAADLSLIHISEPTRPY